jgi:hypothetical protein
MDFLLLIAFLGLAGYTWRLARRVETFEAMLRDSEAERWLRARIAEPRAEPARVVRSAPIPPAANPSALHAAQFRLRRPPRLPNRSRRRPGKRSAACSSGWSAAGC